MSLLPFYSVSPELETLNSLSTEEIKRVEGLRVSNAHGMVLFRDPVDLSDYSLHLDLVICPSVVDIYPEGRPRPEKGSKLNHRALITMFRCPLWFDQRGQAKESLDHPGIERQLRKACLEMSASLVDYKACSGHWTFEVEPF